MACFHLSGSLYLKAPQPSKYCYQLGMKAQAWGGTARSTMACPLRVRVLRGVHRLVKGYTTPSQALSLPSEDLNIHAWTHACEAQLPPVKGNNTVYSEPHVSGCGPGARIQAVPNGMLQHGSSHTNFFWLQNKVSQGVYQVRWRRHQVRGCLMNGFRCQMPFAAFLSFWVGGR